MRIGERIKRIRLFRKMTQKELGRRIGLGEKGGNRLAQYEMGYRVPKRELLIRMAEVLSVSPVALCELNGQNAEEIMEILFWLEESAPGVLNLFQLERERGEGYCQERVMRASYMDGEGWPISPPVGLWFHFGALSGFMREWLIRKEEFDRGEITREEYFEWKIGWPATCDYGGKKKPKKEWRHPAVDEQQPDAAPQDDLEKSKDT